MKTTIKTSLRRIFKHIRMSFC